MRTATVLFLIFVVAVVAEDTAESLKLQIKKLQNKVAKLESTLQKSNATNSSQDATNSSQAATHPNASSNPGAVASRRAPPACSVAKAGCDTDAVLKHASLSLPHCKAVFEALGPQCQDNRLYLHPNGDMHENLAPKGNKYWNWVIVGQSDSTWTLHPKGENKFALETENPSSPTQKYLSSKPSHIGPAGGCNGLPFAATIGKDELWIMSESDCENNHCAYTIVAARDTSLSLYVIKSANRKCIHTEIGLTSGKPITWSIVSQLHHPPCINKQLPLKPRISQWLANYAQLLAEEVKFNNQQMHSIKADVPQSRPCSGWNGKGKIKPPAWCGGLAWKSNQARVHNLHKAHGYSMYADSASQLEFPVGNQTWVCGLMKVGTSIGFLCQDGIKPNMFCKASIGDLKQEREVVQMPTGMASFKNLSMLKSQTFQVATQPMFKQIYCGNHSGCDVQKVTFCATSSKCGSTEAQDKTVALVKWF